MGKLYDRMREDLILKAYSRHTREMYLRCAGHFVKHFMRSPDEMGEQEIREFLLHIVRVRKASPFTQGTYVSAIKFLYTVTLKRPEAPPSEQGSVQWQDVITYHGTGRLQFPRFVT